VPPQLYGGTERVVSVLTEALVGMGHDVTLFASGDSKTAAKLVPCCPRSLRLDTACVDPLAHHIAMLGEVFSRADEFDVIHFHIDYLHFPVSRRTAIPQLTTLHGRLDLPDLAPLYRKYDDMPLVSISDSQRAPLPFANWQRTVYHGMDPNQLSFHPEPGGYLAFLGRISPEKRVDRAIEIAKRVGMPLKIAAKVDKADKEYYESKIKPLLDDPSIEFIGEIGEKDKDGFLGNAAALMFPIDWPEPFGLVMIEAMACGTPVVAFRNGSVPEVIRDGVSGFIVDDVDAAVAATRRALELSRRGCRDDFEARFTAERMARDYLAAYAKVAGAARPDITSLTGHPVAAAAAAAVTELVTKTMAGAG